MQLILHFQRFCSVALLVLMFHATGFGQRLTGPEWAQSIRIEDTVPENHAQLNAEIRDKQAVIDQIKQKIAEKGAGIATGKARNDIPKSGRGALEMVLMEREAELIALQEKLSYLQDPAPRSHALADARRERQINEMMALRDSLGGSVVGSVLGDLDIDGVSKDELQTDFQNELARLVNEGHQNPEPKRPELPHYLKTPSNIESLQGRRSANFSTENANEKVDALRAVSRQLEQLAWQLEEVEAFEDADRLRQQAAGLRQQSRDLVGNRHTGQQR